ncbi:hypothetical protein HC762_01010 [bacterium]|nr:hypothetical protein [bacterium]
MSDGSAFTTRTSSPLAVYRSTRDTRNSLLWNPSSEALLNTEEDEAGRLASFRARFGTAFDVSKQSTGAAGDGEPEGSEVEVGADMHARIDPHRHPSRHSGLPTTKGRQSK